MAVSFLKYNSKIYYFIKNRMSTALQKLNSLRIVQSASVLKGSTFQPNDDEQEKMVIKKFSSKLVSATTKKKFRLFKEHVKQQEALKRQLNGSVNDCDEGGSVAVESERPLSGKGLFHHHHSRPSTDVGKPKFIRRGSSFFINNLKTSSSLDDINRVLNFQAISFMKNTKVIFDALSSSYKSSISFKYDYKKGKEEIDASALVNNLTASSSIVSSRLEDANQVKKKEGINILIDPSFCTGIAKIGISVTYLKPIDLNHSEEVKRVYPAWSTINHSFTLTLTQETSANSSHSSSLSCSLPGWQGRPPIFVPVAKCTLRIIIEDESELDECTKYKLSSVAFFVWPSANARMGIKKLGDFCDSYFLKFATNAPLQGGLTALSTASLHGNLEAVINLIENGASVNTRNKMSKFNTALHEAVIGGHSEIVTYLLKNGASQVLKDENGFIPLQFACMVGNVAIVKLLIGADKAKKALLMVNNKDQKALDLCKSDYLKAKVEDVMRHFGIFAKPRVSIVQR